LPDRPVRTSDVNRIDWNELRVGDRLWVHYPVLPVEAARLGTIVAVSAVPNRYNEVSVRFAGGERGVASRTAAHLTAPPGGDCWRCAAPAAGVAPSQR